MSFIVSYEETSQNCKTPMMITFNHFENHYGSNAKILFVVNERRKRGFSSVSFPCVETVEYITDNLNSLREYLENYSAAKNIGVMQFKNMNGSPLVYSFVKDIYVGNIGNAQTENFLENLNHRITTQEIDVELNLSLLYPRCQNFQISEPVTNFFSDIKELCTSNDPEAAALLDTFRYLLGKLQK